MPLHGKKPCKVTYKHSGQFQPGRLVLAAHASIHPSAEIDLTANVLLSEHAVITQGVKIFTHKHLWNHSRRLRDEIEQIETVPLLIGPDVYIGTDAMILAVSEIGEGAIIGAGAVVTKDVPPFEVWAGNPARKINERIECIEEDSYLSSAHG